jgi:integrase/recombinase XerD
METKVASCNFTKYIKRGPDRWQHCPVVRGKTGRVKQDLVLVEGRIEQHPEGYYSLDWREGGRRHRRALGKDASAAQLAWERHVATRRARAIGIAVAEDGCATSPGVEEACEEFLQETRVQRSPKTFKQYRTALAYFQESCGRCRLAEIDRRTLLGFRQFLADEKKLSPRTICTKMIVVEQMLKTHGRNGLLRRGDWPRYVERVPQAYSPEQLKRFFAACQPHDFLLFQFFLGSGFREREVQFLTWRDIGLEEQLARVTAKAECGFFPKTWEEREALLPSHLIESLRVLRASADPDCPWVFPTQTGCVSYHFLERLKRIAWRAGLNCRACRSKKNSDCRTGPHCKGWFLHKFRATYATNQLRAGTDIRTLQVWMGHKDLASTMRYLKAGHGKDLLERVNAAFDVIAGMDTLGEKVHKGVIT